MLSLQRNILIGTGGGHVFLIDDSHERPERIIGRKLSVLLCYLLTAASEEACREALRQAGMCYSKEEIRKLEIYFIKKFPGAFSQGSNEGSQRRGAVAKKRIESGSRQNDPLSFFRLDYPVHLIYVPTWRCNRSCRYCGVPKTNDGAKISEDLLIERLTEASTKGLQKLDIHGGEPLYYAFEETEHLVAAMKQAEVKTYVSTKNLVTAEMAERLRKAGLDCIQLSLDTIDTSQAQMLGYPDGYLDLFNHSLENIRREDIPVSVNIVVSKENEKGLEELLTFLIEKNIEKITLSPLRKTESVRLHEIEEEGKEHLNQKLSKFGMRIPVSEPGQRPICESGRNGFLILPNGECAFCDFIADLPEFRFGDIKTSTVEEIWNDPKLLELTFPPKDCLTGKCETCEQSEICRSRGFCYANQDFRGTVKEDRFCLKGWGR